MISCVLNGGLCNQLFEMSAAITLALDNNDTYGFNLNVPCVNQGNSPITYKDNVYSKISTFDTFDFDHIHQDDGKKIEYKKNLLLKGYFQNTIHFDSRVREIFVNNVELNKIYCRYKSILRNSVSLHVRRGDYLKYPEVYPILGVDYYTKALEHIGKVDNILVFSDDIEWCKDNFSKKFIFVENISDWESLYLMSLCSYNIIANSSFSWWGAYLNPKDIVVAPKNWSHGIEHNLYTSNMIVI